MPRKDQKLTDHAQVRAWAMSSSARPARIAVRGETGGAPRFSFRHHQDSDDLETVSWEDFFAAFDENDLALLVSEANRPGYEIVAR